jgi:hypothetical protein
MTKRVPMTAGRRLALLIGVPLTLAIIGWTALSEVAVAGVGSYPVRLDVPVPGPAIQVSVDSGNLGVGQAAGDRLRLTGTARYALVRSTVTWSATRAGVSVVSRCHFVTGECSFNYRLTLPTRARVVLSDGSGDITCTGLTSTDVAVADDSGSVTLTFATIPDRVRVSDQFGDITLVLPPGRATYRISTRALFGRTSIRVPTSSSAVHVITVTDQSGDISIRN